MKKPDNTVVALNGYGKHKTTHQIVCLWTKDVDRKAIKFTTSVDANNVLNNHVKRRSAYVYEYPDNNTIDDLYVQYALTDLGF